VRAGHSRVNRTFEVLRLNRPVSFELRKATERDAEGIRALLEQGALPTADIAASRPEFIVAYEDATLVAVGGLQRFGTTALLRSVAVSPARRGHGLGHAIVQRLEQTAQEMGVNELVLLTQTAKQFFADRGYRPIQREHVSPAVQESEEFKSLCPQSACCMSKRLAKE
jgi:amino-acid N-acetyltransferase